VKNAAKYTSTTSFQNPEGVTQQGGEQIFSFNAAKTGDRNTFLNCPVVVHSLTNLFVVLLPPLWSFF
jgi:hypothetical protein